MSPKKTTLFSMECVGSYIFRPKNLSTCMYVYVVVNYLFYGDLEGLGYIYIYMFLPGKNIPLETFQLLIAE